MLVFRIQIGGLVSILLSVCTASPLSPRVEDAPEKRGGPYASPNHHPRERLGRAAPSSPTYSAAATVPPTTTNTFGASPTSSPISSSPVAAETAISPYLYFCNPTQSSMVSEAWAEASQLARAHSQWKPPGWFSDGDYQPAMDMYMGNDSRDDYSIFSYGPLQKNVLRQLAIHAGGAPASTYAYFYCNDYDIPTPEPSATSICESGNVLAYSWDDLGWFWSVHYVVFCPIFYQSGQTTLSALVQQARTDPPLQQVIDPWVNTRAMTVFHETYHWEDTVSVPRCNLSPEVYAPKDVYNLAINKNTATARLNAESWSDAAVATFLQQTFSLANPPTPRAYALDSIANDPGVVSASNGTGAAPTFLDSPPSWWVSPVATNASTFSPDMTYVTQIG